MPQKKSAKFFLALSLGLSGFFLLLCLWIRLGWFIDLPSWEQVQKNHRPSDLWIVDRYGEPMESLRTRKEKRSLSWVSLSEVSPAFQALLIQAEDRRFDAHAGVDFWALLKASWDRWTQGSPRGASTLTMQLVGLVKKEIQKAPRSPWKKIRQIVLALHLNHRWSKAQVLEAYLNLVPFRGELVGLRAASLGYFDKQPAGLVKQEAALLVALIRSPNTSVETIAQRACLLLRGQDCLLVEALAHEIFSKPYRLSRKRELVPVLSPFFMEGSQQGSVISTTLDAPLQKRALKALKEQLRALKKQHVEDGAVLVLETQTGRVAAYLGNPGAGFASAGQVDGVQMRRQAGSTLKPFVYATAFEWNLLHPSSLLEDKPTGVSIADRGIYRPHNFDRVFRGLVSVADALGSSLNIPAVRALELVGVSRVLDRLRALGFQHLHDEDYYGPSLALGAMDVSLWDLTQAYRQLAIDNRVFSKATKKAIFDILAAPEHRRLTFGTQSILTLPFPAAVKTGTSKDMRDNWCVGWTPQYTIGVWVGNFRGDPMWNVSGTSGAAPIWRALMLSLHSPSERRLLAYQAPDTPLPQRTLSRIRYPTPHLLVGLDPEIPLTLQQLPIEVDNPQTEQTLFLNQKALGPAQESLFWPLQRGKYHLELKSTEGRLLDAVRFEVR